MTTHDSTSNDGRDVRRRKFLAAAGAVGAAGLAGCNGTGDDDGSDGDDDAGGDAVGQIGSGRAGRGAPGGTSMSEMPALEGELTVYSGRGEFLVGELVSYIDDLYDDLDLTVRYGGSTDLVNQIANEGEGSPADVFYSVNAGALGALADAGRTQALPDDVTEKVREEFRTEQWVGTSGRARTIPYNTDEYDEGDLPDDIMAYPEEFDGDLGWAPSYGSAQAFITAMRILEGEEATREWLEAMVERGAATYPDEFRTCQEIADGEIDAAFTNHYYIQRVLDGNPEAPIATTFTEGDAGAVFNVAGAAVVDTASDADLASNFVRHLLSAEAQDYFARSTFEYPLIPEVEPIGDLPSIDELDVPDLDLSQLSNLEPTIDLMRDAGVQI
ncbi:MULTISPECIES: extracellular solute-binding protein [unclassified Halorubrum]|jgi:iron(III) transport system substrate-binding protein|uniref:extracellular solute-binding protein n=1 Tax=unclassified Halorubrum TaxID=2642239 RepID=UPI0010F8FCE2|nr:MULTISPECIES: extracellular solute-binding protein [unclassified Halorubrum]TKX43192.1 extracellular solute-binding protein [Halorubrum sp. ARQ200]TKX49687.1 extracellular solute-binding protein [Halorubrum sp. ASP121]TKX62799.1 extracellular solute-binding protein [Halorubrum sp. ASP1]